MPHPLPETDLILNPDGTIYHLGLRPEHLTDIILTVGDPERVPLVSRYFDTIDTRIQRREFHTHIGTLGGRRLMAISSGMGTDNVEILMTELDILANVDLTTRTPKTTLKKLNIIRIGTSGALQASVPLDSHLVSRMAFGLDTLMQFYPDQAFADEERAAAQALATHLSLPFTPYAAYASEKLMQAIGKDMIIGSTVTCPGFYAPQGRSIRVPARDQHLVQKLASYRFNGKPLTNFEMETSGYYALGRLLGHEVLSVNAILANRITGEFSRQPQKTVEALIQKVLERLPDVS